MLQGSVGGIGFALVAAVGLTIQGLAVRLGSKTHPISDVIAVMFAINLVVLIPIAGVLAYPSYHISSRAVLAVTQLRQFYGTARMGTIDLGNAGKTELPRGRVDSFPKLCGSNPSQLTKIS